MNDRIGVLHVDAPERPAPVADRLERWDDRIRVVEATDAAGGLDRVRAGGVDCVVAGHRPPDVDGLASLRAVREETPELPVILFADPEDDVAGEAFEAGAAGYVHRQPDVDWAPVLGNDVVNAVEHRRTERELDEKRTRLDQLFRQVPIHLYVKDSEARIVRVSEHYVEKVGTLPDAEEHVGKTDLELYHEELARETYEDDLRVIETEEPVVNKVEYEPTTGEWNLTTKVPMYDDGEVAGLIGVTRQITRRKEYERRIERQNERLETVAGIISHDLRNPLAVATGALDLARADCGSEHLDAIGSALDRMDGIIGETLTMVRGGQTVETTRPERLSDVARDCWENVATDAAELRIEDDATIEADPNRLTHLLENLFRNAVEHGSTSPPSHTREDAVEHGSTSPRSQAREDVVESDGPDVTVRLGTVEDGFYVEDDGSGIPEADRDRVFDPAYSTGEGGTGFGLAIVEQMAEAHGWTVRAGDGPHGGARFEVTGTESVDG